jgi:hypothetical protein
MTRPTARIVALQATFAVGLLLIIGRAAWLQLVKG